MRTSFHLPSFLALVILGLSGCAKPPAPVNKLSVVASFYPLAFLAQQIGGERVDVLQVTPGGVEPHEYEPAPEQLATVYDAKIFLMNGGGVDAWGDKILDEVRSTGVIAIRVTDMVETMAGFEDDYHEEEHEEGEVHTSTGAITVGTDPHIWLSPVLMQRQAEVIRDAFIQSDPEHKDAYAKNAQVLLKKLASLDGAFRKGLAKCAFGDAVTSHNAFRYLAKEYDFRTLAIAGLSPDEEPSPKRIAELADFARENNIRYIFFETLVSPELAETVASEVGAQPLVLNPIEGLTPDNAAKNDDYFSLMEENLKNLRTALQCP